jgi:hypothetical protein
LKKFGFKFDRQAALPEGSLRPSCVTQSFRIQTP